MNENMKIYNQDLDYDTAFHYHCLKNCICQVLNYRKVMEAYLYIDVSCSFMFVEEGSSYRSELSIPYNNVWKPYQKYMTAETYLDDDVAEQSVSNYLKQDKLVIVAIDSYYQPYRNTYLKHHGSHAIILCDEQEEEYQVVDWYEPYYYKGSIRKDILRKARASENIGSQNPFSGQKIGRISYTFNRFEQSENLNQLFLYGIQQIYDSFYKENYSFINKRIFYGVTALVQLKGFIEHHLVIVGSEKSNYNKVHDDLFLLSIARKLQLYYIETFDEYQLEKLQVVAGIRQSIDLYEKLLFHLLKLSLRWSEEQLKQVLQLVQNIIYIEKNIGHELTKFIDSIGGR